MQCRMYYDKHQYLGNKLNINVWIYQFSIEEIKS